MSFIYLILFFITFLLSCIYITKFVLAKSKLTIKQTLKNKNIKNGKLYLIIILFCLISFVFNMIFALIFLMIFLYVNWLNKTKKQKAEFKVIDEQIIETIRIFRNSLLSGQSLMQAIDTASNQIKAPLSNEFKTISNSVSYGISLDDALLKSSQNIKNRQYKLFIDSVRISNITGAKLVDILDKIEQSVTQKIAINLKVEALTAQGKISGGIISIVPVFIVIFVCLAEPEIMGILWTTTIGNLILFVSCIMILAGSFFMRKIAEINV